MMKAFRYFTMALAVLIMVGEVYRSIGDGRHIMWILDDIFLGLAMLIGAIYFTKDTPPRRAFFAASWGAAAGGVYGSFFSKLLSADPINSGNLNPTFLTAFLGVFFVISILCVILAIRLPYKD
jgi:uncharacterized membrane protein